jgi:hypothetical protein
LQTLLGHALFLQPLGELTMGRQQRRPHREVLLAQLAGGQALLQFGDPLRV